MQTSEPSFLRRDQAIRLTFSYDDNTLELVSQQVVDKRTRDSDPILDPQRDEPQSGFWFELQDDNGKTAYRQILHNPIRLSEEVRPEDRKEFSSQRTVEQPRGTFFLLAPYRTDARNVVIVSSPLDTKRSTEAARPIVRFTLGDDGRSSSEKRFDLREKRFDLREDRPESKEYQSQSKQEAPRFSGDKEAQS